MIVPVGGWCAADYGPLKLGRLGPGVQGMRYIEAPLFLVCLQVPLSEDGHPGLQLSSIPRPRSSYVLMASRLSAIASTSPHTKRPRTRQFAPESTRRLAFGCKPDFVRILQSLPTSSNLSIALNISPLVGTSSPNLFRSLHSHVALRAAAALAAQTNIPPHTRLGGGQ